MSDTVRRVAGTITMADGSTSEFQITGTGVWSQWGADRSRLGDSVDVVDAMANGLIANSLLVGCD
jgi:hypothetical protein